MRKRGISNIIATVLIILVSIVGVAFIWMFMGSLLNSSIGETQQNVELLSLRLDIIENSLVINKSNGSVVFLVERLPGGERLDGFLIVLTDVLGNSVTIREYENTPLAELERIRVSFTFDPNELEDLATISLHGILIETDEQGNPVVNVEPIMSNQPLAQTVIRNAGGGGGSSNNNLDDEEEFSEETSENSQSSFYPDHLPLAASWNTGANEFVDGYDLVWQRDMIVQGHKILPTVSIGVPIYGEPSEKWINRTSEGIEYISNHSIPLTVLSTQWEGQFYNQEALFTPGADYGFLDLPNDTNPNFVHVNGSVLKKVSPFGDVAQWFTLGELWTQNNSFVALLQSYYPEPSSIIFFSNNEANKVRFYELENESRFVNLHGLTTTEEKKILLGDAWISHYPELFAGMRSGLSSSAWKDATSFGSYLGTIDFLFRWSGWTEYSLSAPSINRLLTTPYIWDRTSPDFYVYSDSNLDELRNGYSRSIGYMQVVAQKDWMLEENPDLTFELSTWINPDQEINNPNFNVSMYGGMSQYALWLLKPDVLRHYSDWNRPIEDDLKYYSQTIAAVDRVHDSSLLQDFWMNGTLVLNPNRLHPFHSNLEAAPERFRNRFMWYALDTTLDPVDFPDEPTNQQFLDAQFEVWTIAQVKGEAPDREWLVYSYSTNITQEHFNVTIPDFGEITINATVDGRFYLVNESDSTVTSLIF